MKSTMQDSQLTLSVLLRHGTRLHANSSVTTWTGEGVRSQSYGELGRQAAKLANALRSLGVTKDARVGTFMWNNAEHLAAYAAIPSMGAVLHTLNIRLFPEQIILTANQAEDQVIIVDGSLAEQLAELLPKMSTVRHVIVTGGSANGQAGAIDAFSVPTDVTVHSYEDLLAGQPDTFEWPSLDEHQAAAMCFTSGTTGEPKGVVYSHRSIFLHSMQLCMSDGMRLAESDTALAVVPMFHVLSLGLPYAALLVGASLALPDRFLEPAALADIVATTKPTIAAALPFMWQGLLQHLETNPQDISHLREVMVGGSAAPPALMHATEKHGVPAVHAWGMTETSPWATVARPPKGVSGEEAWKYRYTQGKFPALVEARLMTEDGHQAPWDNETIGEIEVRGPWVTSNYFGKTAVDPEQFRDGWLRTGDVGRITADGYLTLTDRRKDMIKSGGELISSVELENKIMGHPAVLEATVIGIADAKWDERPLAVVVVHEGQQVKPEELRTFLTDKVVDWQVPEYWAFMDVIPRTGVGKFDKKQLRALYADGKINVHSVNS